MANASTHLPITLQAPPTIARSFTVFTTDIDLRQQSGCPTHAAQRLVITNEHTASQDAVIAGTDDIDYTVTVPQASTVVVDAAVRKIDATTEEAGAMTITAFWWTDASTVYNA